MADVHIIKHPILDHSLTILRDRRTTTEEFRRHSGVVSQIMILEATRELPIREVTVATPLTTTTGGRLVEDVVLVPVLRAGLSMLVAAQDLLPWSKVGFIGLERDETTALARAYYQKFPDQLANKRILVLDPMLATGGSLLDVVKRLLAAGAQDICAVCIVSAPEGIRALQEQFPKVDVFTAAVDSHLDANKYIVPGLGDFGDRYFGTL